MKVCLELNWTDNSISKMERKLGPIRILLFGCEWNLPLESNGSTQFQFMFGCINHGIECFVEFGQYKLVYMYDKIMGIFAY